MKRVLTEKAYEKIMEEVREKGSSTHAGEQRHKEGKGLHELVDPKGYGLIRRSISYLDPVAGETFFILLRGIAMLIESRLDSTGSMGNNVKIAMEALPKAYKLLKKTPNAVLARYDVQIITSIFADVCDNYVLCRSQAEMDERIAEQMTLMVPEGNGGDADEDPQYGLFAGTYLTSADANKLGLKTYDFTITDARGRNRLNVDTLIRIFGETVFEKVKENGFDIDKDNLPTTKEVVVDLLKRAHGFVILVRPGENVANFWEDLYGRERIIKVSDTKLIPEVEAAIIGLTEGVLNLSTLEKFLVEEAELDEYEAKMITKAVAGIPIGAQMALPNFDKIPLQGAKYANKGNLWPIGYNDQGEKVETSDTVTEEKPKKKGKKKIWL